MKRFVVKNRAKAFFVERFDRAVLAAPNVFKAAKVNLKRARALVRWLNRRWPHEEWRFEPYVAPVLVVPVRA